MSSRAVSKYLDIYAEQESKDIGLITKSYDYVIVVPVCNESADCLETIFLNIQDNVLIIAVVNSPVGKEQWQKINALFINQLYENSKLITDLLPFGKLLEFNDFNDVLLVDRNASGQQIHSDSGVGLARKIGCDIALKYFTHSIIKYPWIYSTDADVILPQSYFTHSIKACENNSAIVLDFNHFSSDKKLNELQYYYDFKLRYYHVGITFAGTHYDYIPLGSTLIVNMQCYAQVRGFPKRNAGEDFYLLNKIAKIKPIKYLVDGVVVNIQSRFSDRVPFGTGPALSQINELPSTEDYKYYHPDCFLLLKQWHLYLQSLWVDEQLIITSPDDKILHDLYVYLSCESVFKKSKTQITSIIRWQQFIHQWFDSFKVLKSVHFFDKKYPRLNYLELLKTKSFDKVVGSQLQAFITYNDKT